MPNKRLTGRRAMVTGAGRGIGAAIATRFALEGATVVVADIDITSATYTVQEIERAGGKAISLSIDVTDPIVVDQAVRKASLELGGLDVHVNNAGVAQRAAFLTMTLDEWERTLKVNLTGTMLCSQAVARVMIAGGGGRIINIASISGQLGGSERAAYGAAKAGVINLTQVMAIELATHGILVNALAPGPTRVGVNKNTPEQQRSSFSRMPIARFAEPAEIASAALFLASDDCTMTTGSVINVDGGFHSSGIIYR